MFGMIKPFIADFVTGITSDIQGLRLDDIPAAFSMLLNFGLDGRQRMPKANNVHLTFNARKWNYSISYSSTNRIFLKFCDSIRESFSTSFNIKIDRIRNVSFNISLGNFSSFNETLEFSEPEPSVDSIVSLLASALSVNGFDLGIGNRTSRIYEIHQTVDFSRIMVQSTNQNHLLTAAMVNAIPYSSLLSYRKWLTPMI
ncbi:g-protein coupled receptor Mth2 [Caerostris extrusa]|uniref:G-protein coupled receptor Mth2 n=1 Tax=Caerostris extrusa TaxID=172846 RepID=A0AAV4MIJ2_CAEEX|nr:g-protein coupled receptor Mth2 [Caerostris extrusa]